MKKASLFLVAGMMGLLSISCSSKNASASATESEEAQQEASASLDKATFELTGPVATCTTAEQEFIYMDRNDTAPTEEWTTTSALAFDAAGNLTSYKDAGGTSAKKIVRDADGRITKIIVPMIDDMGEEIEYTLAYDYNNQGQVSSKHYSYIWAEWPEIYTRDAQGRIEQVAADPNGVEESFLKYNYLQTDDYGNWTLVEIADLTHGNKQVVRRTITYQE